MNSAVFGGNRLSTMISTTTSSTVSSKGQFLTKQVKAYLLKRPSKKFTNDYMDHALKSTIGCFRHRSHDLDRSFQRYTKFDVKLSGSIDDPILLAIDTDGFNSGRAAKWGITNIGICVYDKLKSSMYKFQIKIEDSVPTEGGSKSCWFNSDLKTPVINLTKIQTTEFIMEVFKHFFWSYRLSSRSVLVISHELEKDLKSLKTLDCCIPSDIVKLDSTFFDHRTPARSASISTASSVSFSSSSSSPAPSCSISNEDSEQYKTGLLNTNIVEMFLDKGLQLDNEESIQCFESLLEIFRSSTSHEVIFQHDGKNSDEHSFPILFSIDTGGHGGEITDAGFYIYDKLMKSVFKIQIDIKDSNLSRKSKNLANLLTPPITLTKPQATKFIKYLLCYFLILLPSKSSPKRNAFVIGHGLEGDLKNLSYLSCVIPSNIPKIDTVILSRQALDPKSSTLRELAKIFNIPLIVPFHPSINDAYYTLHVFLRLIESVEYKKKYSLSIRTEIQKCMRKLSNVSIDDNMMFSDILSSNEMNDHIKNKSN